jgi:hypothetical protein
MTTMKRLIDQVRKFVRRPGSGGISKPPEVEECDLLLAVLESCPESSQFTFDGYEDDCFSSLLADWVADNPGWYFVSPEGLPRLRERISPANLRSCPHFHVRGPDGAPLFTSYDHFDPITFVASSVAVEVAAHGYVWWAVFLSVENNTTMVCGSDLSTTSLTRVLNATFAIKDALTWLRRNKYRLSSRQDVCRVGTVTFFGPSAQHSIRFHRGETLVANPVNAVIDQCADHGPIVISDGAPTSTKS